MSYCGTELVRILAQVKVTQLDFSDEDAYNAFLGDTLIPSAEDIIDDYVLGQPMLGTFRHFNPHNDQTITLDGNSKPVLFFNNKYAPLLGLGTVNIDSTAITASDVKIHKNYVEYDGGIFNHGVQNVELIGSYGYATIPSDIAFTCGELCANVLTDMVRRKTSPNEFMTMLQGGSPTKVLFASPQVFTPALKDLLYSYRIPRVDIG